MLRLRGSYNATTLNLEQEKAVKLSMHKGLSLMEMCCLGAHIFRGSYPWPERTFGDSLRARGLRYAIPVAWPSTLNY